jgi:ubiquinone/menaquinone biosynthesis C-methylase UbiE
MTAPEEPSPLASPEPWNLVADGYVEETMPRFQPYAAHALSLADLAPKSWVLDVAAGPGTLSLLAARAGHRVSALDFSSAMVERLRERAAHENLTVQVELGDGQALPFAQSSFEAAFSMFGLMFFPDRHAGFRELLRVLRPGGRAVVTSWTPMDATPVISTFMEAMREALPGLPFGTGTAPLGTMDDMREEMRKAGFSEVHVEQKSFPERHDGPASLWRSFSRGGAPCVLLHKRLGERGYAEFGEKVVSTLEQKLGKGPVTVNWDANFGVGHKR